MIRNWQKIHPDFTSELQKEWEGNGFTHQDAKEWIMAGFGLHASDEVREWKKFNFTALECQTWKDIRLFIAPWSDCELAYYCRYKGFAPKQIKDNLNEYCKKLEKELDEKLKIAQNYLDFFYPLEQRSKIKRLGIYNKWLTGELSLRGFNNLVWFHCSSNKLTNLDFLNTLPYSEKLTTLVVANNSITSDLNPFSKLVNLKRLDIGGNSFSGSLSPLQSCSQLEELKIRRNTNIAHDLQYLPLSLLEIDCDRKIQEELNLYGNNLVFWQATHSKLMREIGKEIVNDDNDYSKSKLEIIITTSANKNVNCYQCEKKAEEALLFWFNDREKNLDLCSKDCFLSWAEETDVDLEFVDYLKKQNPNLKKIKDRLDELKREYFQVKISQDNNYELSNLRYYQFTLRDDRHFIWENKSMITDKTLPTRLYHAPSNQVQDSEVIPKNSNYVILSYVWGDLSDKKNLTTKNYTYQRADGTIENKKIGVNDQFNATGTTKESIYALEKAIAALELLNKEHNANIGYLWMDQLCINQFDHVEQGNEVPKMREYYSNSIATLIAINVKIGDHVDKNNELGLIDYIISKIMQSSWFNRSWTFQEGLLSKQTIFMFNDALVDGRALARYWGSTQQWTTSDGWINLKSIPPIYVTPLGWSYGARWEQSVQLRLCQALFSVTHRQQTVPIDGIYSILGLLPYGHLVKVSYQQWGHQYSEEELNAKLLEVMRLAIANGFSYEPISWLGPRSNKPELWKYPSMRIDGSSSITGFLEFEDLLDSPNFSDTGWEFQGYKYVATKDDKKEGVKEGDIVIFAEYRKFKFIRRVNGLKIVLPVQDKTTRPIVFKHGSNQSSTEKLFLDMVDKGLIEYDRLGNMSSYYNNSTTKFIGMNRVNIEVDEVSTSEEYTTSIEQPITDKCCLIS